MLVKKLNYMHISQIDGLKPLDPNRSFIAFQYFAKYIIGYTKGIDNEKVGMLNNRHQNLNTDDKLNLIINSFGNWKELNKYFSEQSKAFGVWLLKRQDRTLEHKIEDLFEMFMDECINTPRYE